MACVLGVAGGFVRSKGLHWIENGVFGMKL